MNQLDNTLRKPRSFAHRAHPHRLDDVVSTGLGRLFYFLYTDAVPTGLRFSLREKRISEHRVLKFIDKNIEPQKYYDTIPARGVLFSHEVATAYRRVTLETRNYLTFNRISLTFPSPFSTASRI